MTVDGYFQRGLTVEDIDAARQAKALNHMRHQLAAIEQTCVARAAKGKKLSTKQKRRHLDLTGKIARASEAVTTLPPSYRRHKPEAGKSFYLSRPWMELRYAALHKYGRKCMACGDTEGKMHVDHIKPRSIYPHLELEPSNVQVLCETCNVGKSNLFETDWRQKGDSIEPAPSSRVSYEENALRWACEQAAVELLSDEAIIGRVVDTHHAK